MDTLSRLIALLLLALFASGAGAQAQTHPPDAWGNIFQCGTSGSGADKGVCGASYTDALTQLLGNQKAAWDLSNPSRPLTCPSIVFTDSGQGATGDQACTYMNDVYVINSPLGGSVSPFCAQPDGTLTNTATRVGALQYTCPGPKLCVAPKVLSSDGNSCIDPPNACAASLGKFLSGEMTVDTAGQVTPQSVCQGGCTYGKVLDTGGFWGRKGTAWIWIGDGAQFAGLGTACTASPIAGGGPNDPPGAPRPDPVPKGKCPGTVNGLPVLVDCDQTVGSSGGPAAPSTPPGGAPPPGSGASGASSGPGSAGNLNPTPAPAGSKPGDKGSSTNCSGDKCDTTDCVVVVSGTGDSTQYTKECTVKGEDKGTYCKDNPGSPNCKDQQSSIGGSCAATTCTGDAVQCAIAKDQLARNCATLDPAGPNDPAVVAAGAGDQPSWHPAKNGTSISLANGFDQTNIVAGSCPADQTIQVSHFNPVTIPVDFHPEVIH